MKPRNRFEKAVLAESKHLRPITKTQSKWAFRECIGHFAYRLPKGRTTCKKQRAIWKSHTNLTHPGKYFRPSKVKIMRPTSPK